jgi:hypothetical protein
MATLAGVLASISAPALAKDEGKPPETPKIVRDLLDCRAIVDSAARLACFDATAAAFDNAAQSREIVIADKEQVRSARRGLFGFATPIGKLFGFGGDDDSGDEAINRVDTTVKEVRQSRDGNLKLVFAEGGTWELNDRTSFPLTPRVGDKATIRRGSLGSYFVSVDGMAGLKFRRVE